MCSICLLALCVLYCNSCRTARSLSVWWAQYRGILVTVCWFWCQQNTVKSQTGITILQTTITVVVYTYSGSGWWKETEGIQLHGIRVPSPQRKPPHNYNTHFSGETDKENSICIVNSQYTMQCERDWQTHRKLSIRVWSISGELGRRRFSGSRNSPELFQLYNFPLKQHEVYNYFPLHIWKVIFFHLESVIQNKTMPLCIYIYLGGGLSDKQTLKAFLLHFGENIVFLMSLLSFLHTHCKFLLALCCFWGVVKYLFDILRRLESSVLIVFALISPFNISLVLYQLCIHFTSRRNVKNSLHKRWKRLNNENCLAFRDTYTIHILFPYDFLL